MKVRRVSIEVNDDKTFQVNVDFAKDNGEWTDKSKKYGAKTMAEVVSHVEDAMKNAPKDEKKKGRDQSVKTFAEM